MKIEPGYNKLSYICGVYVEQKLQLIHLCDSPFHLFQTKLGDYLKLLFYYPTLHQTEMNV